MSKAAALVRDIECANYNNGDAQNTPIISHHFSSGAFIAERMDVLVNGGLLKELKETSKPSEYMKFICNMIEKNGCEVLDSSPPFISASTVNRAINNAIPPNVFLRMMIKLVVQFVHSVQNLRFFIIGLPSFPLQFWNQMLNSQLCKKQMIIYSEQDDVAECDQVESFLSERKRRGIDVSTVKFEDSFHVLHKKKYPKECGSTLDNIIQTVVS